VRGTYGSPVGGKGLDTTAGTDVPLETYGSPVGGVRGTYGSPVGGVRGTYGSPVS